MRFWPIGSTIPNKQRFWLKSLVVLLALVALGMTLGGCKLFMPPEIRNIEQTLGARAQTLETNHLSTAHNYTVEGRTMHEVGAGTNGSVPLILFVHGSPGDWKAWAQYLSDPDLATRAHMIAVDRPGFGGSEAGKVEPSLEQQSRDIAPLLDQAAPGQRVILVGHSFGGPVICRLAMDHPDQVTDLIVLAGSIDPGQEQTKWYQLAAEWRIFRWLVPADLQTANREIMPLKGCLIEMLPLWPKIHQRVTVIQGLADNLVPPENADFAQRMMTNARPLEIIRIPGMNHFLPWKQYSLVKKTILEHLQ
jgi:pimeloyl-ACP methyl ester carboxylesterase